MKRTWGICALSCVGIVSCIGLTVLAQEGGGKPVAPSQAAAALPKCPVMGEQIDFSVRTDTADGPVYFCCPMCIAKHKKDSAKYAEAVKAQRDVLARRPRVQTLCPVSGKAVDGKTSAEVNGQKVSFCCPMCVDKYKADPGKYKGALEGSFTYQTKCPVSGDDIDPSVGTDLATGQRIYFCCKECIEKFNKDVAAYVPKLAEQGVRVDVKKLRGK